MGFSSLSLAFRLQTAIHLSFFSEQNLMITLTLYQAGGSCLNCPAEQSQLLEYHSTVCIPFFSERHSRKIYVLTSRPFLVQFGTVLNLAFVLLGIPLVVLVRLSWMATGTVARLLASCYLPIFRSRCACLLMRRSLSSAKCFCRSHCYFFGWLLLVDFCHRVDNSLHPSQSYSAVRYIKRRGTARYLSDS